MDIKLENDKINLYVDNRSEPMYSIGWYELGNTVKINGSEISEWIDHLQNKDWVDITGLYKLARKIHKSLPRNRIDWVQTFYPVEKDLFLKQLESEGNSRSDSEEVNFQYLLDKIQKRRNFTFKLNKIDPNLIERRVMENLRLNGIS
ncbi:hypothetical protein [Salegentibacter salarius]|uniref:Uncharacterized protein n=1 Tax=Salegentibacter salarius TaxID=435906 RepID=A0A2N0TRJ5_9FLAO|nr:hypothetical protein [Salegentibacter salarius]OEY71960.1 hypothetical protein BHS39_14680 [Salegentibacter salarius]PKD17316.1 hypothetical protein APR40_14650 [Salegentibacter salarius]SLK05574.1 hypothetical protein SAMN05660445_03019 [Salegentibacter salarius]